jgi:hypothetical protein
MFCLIIVLLLVGYVSSDIFGERISKKHLRGLRGEMIKQRVQESFERAFNNVYFGIIAAAQDGKSEYKFAFVCKETDGFLMILPFYEKNEWDKQSCIRRFP